MARNQIVLDTAGMDQLLMRLARVEHESSPEVVAAAMAEIAGQIDADTAAAVQPGNLPAGGEYSQGETAASVITDTSVRWDGMTAWLPIGFDFGSPGAGGYLISGTPRMRPVSRLRQMLRQKKYMAEMHERLWKIINDHINEAWNQ